MDERTTDQAIEAEYALEAPAKCGFCKEQIDTVLVVRLLRTRVNFTSALPRRGQVIVCSKCRTFFAGGLGGLL